MRVRDPFDAWESGRAGQRVLALRRRERGGAFGVVIEERKPGTPLCRVAERWLVNFGSADVLALDQHPFFAEAVARGACEWGTGCGASRVYQTMKPCADLEVEISKLTGCQDAILFNSVTTVHCGVLPSLARYGRVQLILDSFVHNSVHRACEIASARGASVCTFLHNDLDDLRRIMAESDAVPWIAVDSVYSMTGEFAPLQALSDIAAAANGYLYVDDAHGTGLYGAHGGGYVTQVFGRIPEHIVIAGSLSKALCGYGGFLAGARRFRPFIECAAEGFLFNGPVPAPYIAADQAIMGFLRGEAFPSLRAAFELNRERLRDALRGAGLEPMAPESHILAVQCREEDALALGQRLLAHGLLANVAVFPAVPRGQGVVRFTPSVLHREADFTALSAALRVK